MNKTLIKIFGILLALGSFIFIMWVLLGGNFKFTREMFTNRRFNFGQALVLNILGFIGLTTGLKLAGSKLFSFQKRKEPYSSENRDKEKPKIEKKETPLKDFGKDEHDRFMPK